MIELFLVGTLISAYKHIKLIDREFLDNSNKTFDRKMYILAHIHNLISTLFIFAVILYILMALSMLLNYFKYEYNTQMILSVFEKHKHLKKFHTQFLPNMVKVIGYSLIVQVLFVLLLMLVNHFNKVRTKEKAKFEFILSTIVSFVSIAIIIIYVI
jgi:NADH:ubiquinone oxidoreductase subunit 6 (subunit J)